MNEKIINYLKENKDKFSKEVLIEELKKVGYLENEIVESARLVYGENILSGQPAFVSNNNFWDFKSKKIYTNPSEKWKDFLFGFFGPYVVAIAIFILSFVLGFFGFLLNIAFIIFYIFALIYLFNRRKFIAYGLAASLAGIIFVPLIISIIIFGGATIFE